MAPVYCRLLFEMLGPIRPTDNKMAEQSPWKVYQ